MKAVVKYGREDGDVELRDVPEPEVAPGSVLVQVRVAAVCGSDVHMWHDTQSWPVSLPLVLGHETAGVVVEVGRDVEGWSVGDRVVCETAAEICGTCAYCRGGAYNLCSARQGYGAQRNGSFTSLVLAEPRVLHRIPDNVSFEHAALTEPLCVAFNAVVERASVRLGDLVVVQGSGPIGLLALLVARLRGARTTVLLGTAIDSHRLEVGRGLGADHCLDITEQDPVELLAGLGDGLGADLVVDATGSSAAFASSMQLVRPGGAIAKVGWGPQPLRATLDPLVAKAVTVYGSFSHTWGTWERALTILASGQADVSAVIGGIYDLADWRQAFTAMESGRNVKSVLRVS